MKTITLKAVLEIRENRNGEPVPLLLLIDTTSGSTYKLFNYDGVPRCQRGASTRREATIDLEVTP